VASSTKGCLPRSTASNWESGLIFDPVGTEQSAGRLIILQAVQRKRTAKEKKMASQEKSRILGCAFLLQALTSLISGTVFSKPLAAEEGIVNLAKIADNALLLKLNILGQTVTAMGIVFLAALLFAMLKDQNNKMALTAFGIYILEASLLAVCEIADFSLLCISQEYAASGQPEILQTLGNLVYKSMKYGQELHMAAFCTGAILFYYLLYKSEIVPRALSLWGLLAVIPCLIATVSAIFDTELPFLVYLPYVPFEFFIGLWILIRGTRHIPETA
jgi:hypothetical protein